MRKFFAVAMGSVVALVGFAGAANASATVDLRWIDISVTNAMGNPICLNAAQRPCPDAGTGTTISSVATTESITLVVILTAGPAGSLGGGVSVDYGELVGLASVTGFQSLKTKKSTNTDAWLPLTIGTTTDQPTFIDNINAAASPPTDAGIGLPAGQSAYLGTVSFHQDTIVNGTFEVSVGVTGDTDDILDFNGGVISATTTFNSAFLVNVPEPGALSLLVLGVGGMLLAGRGRRS